ncbi:MAG: GFA family protein [Proteobacteria bacterium]|nr:GFA family protein [Pseudomonadota bacterium]
MTAGGGGEPTSAVSAPAAYLGGCACGALRFRASAPPIDAGYCHCRLCQRTTGAPVLAYASFPVGAFAYTTGKPARYASSDRGHREFCDRCGTQIAFRARPAPATVDVNVGALDEPARVPPRRHLWTASAIPWLNLADDLPRHAGSAPGG